MDNHAIAPRTQRLVLATGAVIGLCIQGDSLMYAVLPLEAPSLGFALPLVGILLSANRLVRLASNTWVSGIFERLGPRWPFAGAALLGLLTTGAYGLGAGFLVFLLARLGWGVAWSGLRQGGYQAVWSGHSDKTGRSMGLLWGLVRLGSAIAVLSGGYLRDRFGFPVSVLAITLVTALALPVALSLPWPSSEPAQPRQSGGFLAGWRQAARTPPSRWLLASSFLDTMLEAVLVSTAALFLMERFQGNDLPILGYLGTATGVLLAARWLSGLFFAPLVGTLADRFGHANALVLLTLALFACLLAAVILGGLLPLGALVLAMLSSSGLFITLNATASRMAQGAERPHLYVGVFSTAIDAGAAAGPLLAYTLASLTGLGGLYLLVGGAYTLAALRFWSLMRSAA